MLLEQQQMIESLKEQLHRLLKHRFGPRSEVLDVSQSSLFADSSIVVELPQSVREAQRTGTAVGEPPVRRKKAVRVLKDLPRETHIVDLPESQRRCDCCGEPMHHFADECSEHLHYVPERLKIIATRRKKYACRGCHGQIKRAPIPTAQPLAKSMASASVLAYLIVSKFADGLPLYRIAARLQRLGVELSHALMSDWLVQCAELLEELHRRMIRKVLDGGHVFTDDTTLPLQNHDRTRHGTFKAKLWVYARSGRGRPPLVAYEFSRSRSQEAPLQFLKDYRGYLQADAFPGYDPLYAQGTILEVACNVHARRKFLEVAEMMKEPGRAHEALQFYKALFRIEREIAALTDEERYQERQRRAVPILLSFKTWLDAQALAVLPKSGLGEAIGYALRNWEALCRYTEAGQLEASNNYAEQCMRPVAVGRKAFLFVGSERAGHAAAIYYSIVESCRLNKVNPLTYMTHVLTHARNRSIRLPTPDEFTASDIVQVD
jgi:transposase